MIATVTLNPGLDLTYRVDESALGDVEVHRSRAVTLEASGKGVNVSRALHTAGVATTAVIPSAGPTGRHLTELLHQDGVACVSVPVAGDGRINSTLLLPHGQTVKVNGPGCTLTADGLDAILAAVDDLLTTTSASAETWLVIAGSLPPGTPVGTVGGLVELAHRHTARCAVDVSGRALAEALDAGADLLAPNQVELMELLDGMSRGGGLPTTALEVAECAKAVSRARGVELLVSMGRVGGLHTDGTGVVHGGGPPLTPVNSAGAGDAFLAGWLAAPGPPADRMARATAWGRSACLSQTTVDPAPGSRGNAGIVVTVLDPPTPTERHTSP